MTTASTTHLLSELLSMCDHQFVQQAFNVTCICPPSCPFSPPTIVFYIHTPRDFGPHPRHTLEEPAIPRDRHNSGLYHVCSLACSWLANIVHRDKISRVGKMPAGKRDDKIRTAAFRKTQIASAFLS